MRFQTRLQSLLDRSSGIENDATWLTKHQLRITDTLTRFEEEIDEAERMATTVEASQTIEKLRTSMKNAALVTLNDLQRRINNLAENNQPISGSLPNPPQETEPQT